MGTSKGDFVGVSSRTLALLELGELQRAKIKAVPLSDVDAKAVQMAYY
jgi:hypothetical protein